MSQVAKYENAQNMSKTKGIVGCSHVEKHCGICIMYYKDKIKTHIVCWVLDNKYKSTGLTSLYTFYYFQSEFETKYCSHFSKSMRRYNVKTKTHL